MVDPAIRTGAEVERQTAWAGVYSLVVLAGTLLWNWWP